MASAIICPACRAQNRSNWEFCARCGEALDRAPTQVTSHQQTLTGVAALSSDAPRDASSFYLILMVVTLVGTVALACRDIARQPTPPPATPGVFTFGGPLPASPAPVAAAANPGVEEARRLLAEGRTAEAISLLERAAGEEPGNAEYRHMLGQARWSTGDREGALQSYAEAARLDPAAYRAGYAQMLEMIGRVADATVELEAVLAVQPGNAIAEEGLSRLYFNRGDYAKALPLLETLAGRTRDPVVLQQLAYAAEKAGDRERAIAAYRDVLTDDTSGRRGAWAARREPARRGTQGRSARSFPGRAPALSKRPLASAGPGEPVRTHRSNGRCGCRVPRIRPARAERAGCRRDRGAGGTPRGLAQELGFLMRSMPRRLLLVLLALAGSGPRRRAGPGRRRRARAAEACGGRAAGEAPRPEQRRPPKGRSREGRIPGDRSVAGVVVGLPVCARVGARPRERRSGRAAGAPRAGAGRGRQRARGGGGGRSADQGPR